MKKNTAKMTAAIKLFEDFTGDKPGYIDTVKLPIDTVCVAIGYCDGVLYSTVRDGQNESYVHEFKKGARPVLAVSSNGKQLYLLAGSYRFTDRGIVDEDK